MTSSMMRFGQGIYDLAVLLGFFSLDSDCRVAGSLLSPFGLRVLFFSSGRVGQSSIKWFSDLQWWHRLGIGSEVHCDAK